MDYDHRLDPRMQRCTCPGCQTLVQLCPEGALPTVHFFFTCPNCQRLVYCNSLGVYITKKVGRGSVTEVRASLKLDQRIQRLSVRTGEQNEENRKHAESGG